MKKILIVDDVETNRKLLRQMLVAMKGYEVIEAVNGKDAIRLFEEKSPDLILMDVNMPEMNGYQSAAAIKAVTGDNHIPIIFVTALSAEASLASSLASGGDDFIGKPFDAEVLASKINAHLRIRELNQQLSDKNKQLNRLNQHLTHEQELIQHFFESALQQSFLDKKFIKYHMSSMSAFAGDLLLVERGLHGGMYLVMGDFTGHGLSAAMGTLPVALVFFKMVAEGAEIGDIARELNHQLNKLMPPSMFFAATLFELNARGDILSVWMGGMPESYWLGKEGALKGTIQAQHMPLGVLQDSEFDAKTEIFNVEKGDKVYLYSDGVIEAETPEREIFGSDRLKALLNTQGDDRFERVLSELKAFTGASDQNDDMTLVEITCCDIPAAEHEEDDGGDEDFVLPWQMSVSLSAREMRRQDPVAELSGILGSVPVLAKHKGVLHVLLSEMYFNALDYSILGLGGLKKENEEQFLGYYKEREAQLHKLEDASIVFELSFFPDPGGEPRLQIRIQDSGKGYKGHNPSASDDKLRGRGLEIINNFCDNVSFSDNGTTLEALYRL